MFKEVMDFKSIFLKIIKTGIILTLFTPLVLIPFGFSSSGFSKTVFFRSLIEIIFVFYLLLVFLDSKYLPRISALLLAVSCFVTVLILTSFTGINFYRSFWGDLLRGEGVILHLHLLVFFLVLISIFRRKEQWLKLFKITVVVSAISSFAGILQKLDIFSFYGLGLPNRISGTWVNPDFFAFYIILVIFLGVFVLASEKEKNWRFVWISILVLNFFTLILSGTRAAWLGMGTGMIFLFCFWFFGFSKITPKKRKLILLGILFLSIFSLLIILNQERLYLAENPYFRRVISTFDWTSNSVQSRIDVWRIAIRAWEDRPVFGWGLESFGFVFGKYFKADYFRHIPENIHFDRPHNKILGLAATTGILGVLSYLSIFFVGFYLLVKAYKFRPVSSSILGAFLISFFVQNLFCFDTIGAYLIFYLVGGFINNHLSLFKRRELFSKLSPGIIRNTLRKERIFFKRKFFLGLKIILVALLAFLSLVTFYCLNFRPTAIGLTYVKAKKLEAGNFSKAFSQYKNIITKDTIFEKDFREKVAFELLGRIRSGRALKSEKKEIIKTLSDLKLFFQKRLEKPDKAQFSYYLLITQIDEEIYLFTGEAAALQELEEVSKVALSFNNQRPEFYRILGKAKIFQGNYAEGEKYFRKALNLSSGSIQDEINFYQYLGVAYSMVGDRLKAAENFKEALKREFALVKADSGSFRKDPESTIALVQMLMRFYYQDVQDSATCRQLYQRAKRAYPAYQEQLQDNFEKLTGAEGEKQR